MASSPLAVSHQQQQQQQSYASFDAADETTHRTTSLEDDDVDDTAITILDNNDEAGRIVPPPRSWFEEVVEATTRTTPDVVVTREVVDVPQPSPPYDTNDDERNVENRGSMEEEDLFPKEAYPPSDSDDDDDDDVDTAFSTGTQRRRRRRKSQTVTTTTTTSATNPPVSSSDSSNNSNHGMTTTTTTNDVGAAVAVVVGASPSWQEISSQVLPAAAQELLSSSIRRLCYTTQSSYYNASLRLFRRHCYYSDYGNYNAAGYFRSTSNSKDDDDDDNLQEQLPPFSSLPWVDRQMVKEWRTYLPDDDGDDDNSNNNNTHNINDSVTRKFTVNDDDNDDDDNEAMMVIRDDEEDLEFDRARTLVPVPQPRPVWNEAEACQQCYKTFGPTRLRHHCRRCGGSYCQVHSSYTHKLPQWGYHPAVPERVCDTCKRILLEQNLAERVAWRLARCRDYHDGRLQPYFEVGLDSVEKMMQRITYAALAMAKSVPLGAQATVAVETVDVLRKYGLNGIYTIMLRQEFLAAADMLRKALGINRTAWPLSVHELSAAIFYALAQHRAMRGMNPEREHRIHAFCQSSSSSSSSEHDVTAMAMMMTTTTTTPDPIGTSNCDPKQLYRDDDIPPNHQGESVPSFFPACHPVPNEDLTSMIFYAPIALNFIYVEKEVDMQLLAAQQGWRLVYAYLDQEDGGHKHVHDRPASALFVHEEQKIACLAVRGTSTIQDVITDIRQVPVPFPDPDSVSRGGAGSAGTVEEEWTTVFRGHGLAVAGMAGAAVNLYREHIDSLLSFAQQGYRIRMTGHSLGGAVASLLGCLVYKDLAEMAGKDKIMDGSTTSTTEAVDVRLHVYAYGTPSCVDLPLSEAVESFVTTVVLHDDVVPRLTPTSCRGLLKHLLHIRETWVRAHFPDDVKAFTDRAKTAWAPRWRGGFTLTSSSSVKLKRYYRKQIQNGKKKLRSVKDKLVGDDFKPRGSSTARILEQEDDYAERSSRNLHLTPSDNAGTSLWAEDTKSPPLAAAPSPCTEGGKLAAEDDSQPRLVMDIMGGMDSRSEGLVVDGDEFFDPEEHLVESSDDESGCSSEILDESVGQFSVDTEETGMNAAVTLDGQVAKLASAILKLDDADTACVLEKSEELDDNDSPGAVVLEETPLPRMFIPGKIVHLYAHRGVYKAAYVPRAFRELRRISMAGNMLSDHKTKSYYDALLEVSSVRRAAESPPQWTAFDEDDTCSCCASRFTWASTSDNEAQEARDKHNCRSCGSLVCHPCSRNRIPVPSIGLTGPARVCDRCYNDIDGLLAYSQELGRDVDNATRQSDVDEEKPVRQREKRSAVVDELASRVQASALTCN